MYLLVQLVIAAIKILIRLYANHVSIIFMMDHCVCHVMQPIRMNFAPLAADMYLAIQCAINAWETQIVTFVVAVLALGITIMEVRAFSVIMLLLSIFVHYALGELGLDQNVKIAMHLQIKVTA